MQSVNRVISVAYAGLCRNNQIKKEIIRTSCKMSTSPSEQSRTDVVMATASPAVAEKNQTASKISEVQYQGKAYTKVQEGQAHVLFEAASNVFYNPVQEFNRDLSIAILRVFEKDYSRVGKDLQKRKRREAYRRLHLAESAEGPVSPSSDPNTTEKNHSSTQQSVGTATERLQETTNSCNSNDNTKMEIELNFSKSNNEDSKIENDDKELMKTGLHGSATSRENSANPSLENGEDGEEKLGLRVLEALAASGLRSIRYAKEVPGITEIVANDLSEQAVECMKLNIEYNNLEHLIKPSQNDASLLLYQNRCNGGVGQRFDVIDLDPYGSPSIFLDGAVQSVTEGGLLLVTCTDMGVLCGNSPETCFAKYGSTSLKIKACHEMALRIALQCVQSHANRYGRYIEPLISVSVDFYIRFAVRVYTNNAKVKECYTQTGPVYHCVGCNTVTPQVVGKIEVNGKSIKHKLGSGPPVGERCQHCNSRHQMAGPVWLGPLHDQSFLQRLLEHFEEEPPHLVRPLGTQRRIQGLVQMILEELPDVPLYYVHDTICSTVGSMPGKLSRFKSALLNAGYRVSESHCHKASIKTDAPASVVWDIVREHEKTQPAHRVRRSPHEPGYVILHKDTKTKVDFTLHPNAQPESREKNLLRFQQNPEKNWGPLARATTKFLGQNPQDKGKRNQGRKLRNERYRAKVQTFMDAEAQGVPNDNLISGGDQSIEKENTIINKENDARTKKENDETTRKENTLNSSAECEIINQEDEIKQDLKRIKLDTK